MKCMLMIPEIGTILRGGGGVNCRLEPFRKFIRFGTDRVLLRMGAPPKRIFGKVPIKRGGIRSGIFKVCLVLIFSQYNC